MTSVSLTVRDGTHEIRVEPTATGYRWSRPDFYIVLNALDDPLTDDERAACRADLDSQIAKLEVDGRTGAT